MHLLAPVDFVLFYFYFKFEFKLLEINQQNREI